MTSRGSLTKVASHITDQQHNNAFAFPPNQQVGVDPNHDLSYGDQSARRKRSKVSRACDECRRKKVSICCISNTGSASYFAIMPASLIHVEYIRSAAMPPQSLVLKRVRIVVVSVSHASSVASL